MIRADGNLREDVITWIGDVNRILTDLPVCQKELDELVKIESCTGARLLASLIKKHKFLGIEFTDTAKAIPRCEISNIMSMDISNAIMSDMCKELSRIMETETKLYNIELRVVKSNLEMIVGVAGRKIVNVDNVVTSGSKAEFKVVVTDKKTGKSAERKVGDIDTLVEAYIDLSSKICALHSGIKDIAMMIIVNHIFDEYRATMKERKEVLRSIYGTDLTENKVVRTLSNIYESYDYDGEKLEEMFIAKNEAERELDRLTSKWGDTDGIKRNT